MFMRLDRRGARWVTQTSGCSLTVVGKIAGLRLSWDLSGNFQLTPPYFFYFVCLQLLIFLGGLPSNY